MTLEEKIKNIPPFYLAVALLLMGIALLYLFNPPYSKCSAQIDVFKASQVGFLYPNPNKSYSKAGYFNAVETCKLGNSPGACRDLFDGLKKMSMDALVVPQECKEELGEVEEVTGAIWGSLSLFTEIAWGEKAPGSSFDKQGWLDNFHVHVFCRLKEMGISLQGEERWREFVESMFKKLPQANQLSREDAWPRSIMSVRCQDF